MHVPFLSRVSVTAVSSSAWRCRWVLRGHVLSLLLELSVMVVMCLNLASNAKHPHEQLDEDSRTDQTAIMVVSLCTTLATFVLTMIGAGSALTGLRVVAKRISTAGRNMRISAAGNRIAHSRDASQAGIGASVVPLHTYTHPS